MSKDNIEPPRYELEGEKPGIAWTPGSELFVYSQINDISDRDGASATDPAAEIFGFRMARELTRIRAAGGENLTSDEIISRLMATNPQLGAEALGEPVTDTLV